MSDDTRSQDQIDNEDMQHRLIHDVLSKCVNSLITNVLREPVRVPVLQAALGELVTDTFQHVKSAADRQALVDSFCSILRETVEAMDTAGTA